MIKKSQLHNRVNRDLLKQQIRAAAEPRTTMSFYRYHQIANPKAFRDELYLLLDSLGTKGRIYVAHEGINAQISIPTAKADIFKAKLYEIDWLNGVRLNVAVESVGHAFIKLVIKTRPKIVADGLDDATFDPSDTGTHLDAEAFNALTDDPNTVVVDMRNHYESEVGFFENAIRPPAETFREELKMTGEILRGMSDKNVVMYCTGGIRCEKASAWFKHQGFKNVFQLDGGIIQYARQVREKGLKNKFHGVNFVFDERLGERISEDIVANCHQCGQPCDAHTDCANDACHLLFIQCADCKARFDGCCSTKCLEFQQLPKEQRLVLQKTEIFNGSRFGKGRFSLKDYDGFSL